MRFFARLLREFSDFTAFSKIQYDLGNCSFKRCKTVDGSISSRILAFLQPLYNRTLGESPRLISTVANSPKTLLADEKYPKYFCRFFSVVLMHIFISSSKCGLEVLNREITKKWSELEALV